MSDRKHTRPAVLIVVCVVSLWILSALLIPFISSDWAVRGQVGDMFGAVNSLFSGLALAGIVYAILLQRQELELQRKELAMTRAELRRSAEAHERSQATLARQAQNQVLAARLQALSALLSHRGRLYSDHSTPSGFRATIGAAAEGYAQQIEALLDELGADDDATPDDERPSS